VADEFKERRWINFCGFNSIHESFAQSFLISHLELERYSQSSEDDDDVKSLLLLMFSHKKEPSSANKVTLMDGCQLY
jgi:hypothetical protein